MQTIEIIFLTHQIAKNYEFYNIKGCDNMGKWELSYIF